MQMLLKMFSLIIMAESLSINDYTLAF